MISYSSHRSSLFVFLLLGFFAGCASEENSSHDHHEMSEDATHHEESHPAGTDRQTEVARRGAEVMLFDLEKTMHVFKDLEDGGVQQVVAIDSTDIEQIAHIRKHLQEEATMFQRGDFSDPARIHGSDMPGLKALEQNADQLEVQYRPLTDGGEIRYMTDDPTIIRALHAWFEAQRSDHGRHVHGG